jgi:hypothetical protein
MTRDAADLRHRRDRPLPAPGHMPVDFECGQTMPAR